MKMIPLAVVDALIADLKTKYHWDFYNANDFIPNAINLLEGLKKEAIFVSLSSKGHCPTCNQIIPDICKKCGCDKTDKIPLGITECECKCHPVME